MADPADTGSDVEDVLSSIRRLVAAQPGPHRPRESAPQAASPASRAAALANADKLLLTAALRVPDRRKRVSRPLPAALAERQRDTAPDTGATTLEGGCDRAEAGDQAQTEPATAASADAADHAGRPLHDEGPAARAQEESPPPVADSDGPWDTPFQAADHLGENDARHALETADTIMTRDETDGAGGADHEPAGTIPEWPQRIPLFEWQVEEERAIEGLEAAVQSPTREFEPETGDEDWPDAAADRALRARVAARDAATPDGSDVPGTSAVEAPQTASGRASSETADESAPVFSRTSGAWAPPHDAASRPETDASEQTGLNPFSSAAISEIRGEAAAEWLYDDTHMPVRSNGAPSSDGAAKEDEPGSLHNGGAETDIGKPSPTPAATSTAQAGFDQTPEPAQVATSDAAEARVADPDPKTTNASSEREDGPTSAPAEAGIRVTQHVDDAAKEILANGHAPWSESLDAAAPAPLLMEPEQRVDLAGAPDLSATDAAMVPPADTVSGDDSNAVSPDQTRTTTEAPLRLGHDQALEVDTSRLDEETLRRIVAEVVREELQGALGERITRNIRKLVRREIRLVLAADEID